MNVSLVDNQTAIQRYLPVKPMLPQAGNPP